MGADDLRTTVVDDVFEIVRNEPIVDWYQNRADLRDRIVPLQMRVRVRGNVSDPIAPPDIRVPGAPRTSGRSAPEIVHSSDAIRHRQPPRALRRAAVRALRTPWESREFP